MNIDVSYWSILLSAVNWSIIAGAIIVIPFRRSPAAAQSWLLLFFFLPWAALVAALEETQA